MMRSQGGSVGKVYFVGAGPGDPRLVTTGGLGRLITADVVLYDCLVSPALLGHAPPSAELVPLGGPVRGGFRRRFAQEELNDLLVARAREGNAVVYLKGGDPSVFAHTAEEAEALRAAGIPFEIVPGVTAALAAAGYAEIPITHAGHCSAVALVTAQQPRGATGLPLDYGSLAAFPGSLVFYMGEGTADRWSRALIRGGRSPHTPVAVVQRCTHADQETIRCSLATVADTIAGRDVRPPTVILVGQVVSLAPEVSWFASRELFGTRVLVTRPRHQAEQLCARLSERGADVLRQPAIEITDPTDWAPVDRALAEVHRYDWLVFSSANGVCYFLDRLWEHGGDLRRLGGLRLAAIGPGTAERLERYRLRADLVPEEYRAEALAERLAPEAGGKRFLLVRASRGREVLAQRLTAARGLVDQVVVYRSMDVKQAEPEVGEALAEGRIDWITVSSSAIARSLVGLFGEHLRQAKLASISPVTSEVLRGLGFGPAAEARRYTMDGLVDAILAHRRPGADEPRQCPPAP